MFDNMKKAFFGFYGGFWKKIYSSGYNFFFSHENLFHMEDKISWRNIGKGSRILWRQY